MACRVILYYAVLGCVIVYSIPFRAQYPCYFVLEVPALPPEITIIIIIIISVIIILIIKITVMATLVPNDRHLAHDLLPALMLCEARGACAGRSSHGQIL